jgi:hypothetical protein
MLMMERTSSSQRTMTMVRFFNNHQAICASTTPTLATLHNYWYMMMIMFPN